MTARPASPVPRRAVMLELLRSGGLLLTLVITGLLLALVGSWILGLTIAAIIVAVFAGGIVPRPTQILAARRPPEVMDVEVRPWERGRVVWASLTPLGREGLCVPLRSPMQARRLAPGPFPGQVAGHCKPGSWVVLQVGQVSFWPAGPVRNGLPVGAAPVRPASETRRRPTPPTP